MCKIKFGFGSFFLAIVLLLLAGAGARAQKQDPFAELPAGGDIVSATAVVGAPNSMGSATAFCTSKNIFYRYGPFPPILFWSVPPGDGEIYKMSLKTGKAGKPYSLLVLTTNGQVFQIPLEYIEGMPVIPSSNSVLEFDPIAQYRYNKIVGDDIYVQTTSGLVFVTSNDTVWTIDTTGLGSGANDIVLDTSQNVFTVTNSGFYEQAPSERSWHFLSKATSGIYFLFVSHADILYAATNNGLMSSADHGTTWGFDSTGMGNNQFIDHMCDDSLGTLYATSSYGSNSHSVWMKPVGGVWRSIGAALKNLAYDSVEQLSEDYLTGITVDSGIHVATSFGLFSSYDGGVTWNPDNNGIPAEDIYTFYQFPDGRRMTSTNLALFASKAGDTLWSKSFPQNSYLPGVRFFVDNAKRTYALGTSREEGVVSGFQINYLYFPNDFFISTDEGSTWEPDTTGLSLFASKQGNYSTEFVDETGTEHVATYETPHTRLFSKAPGGSWQGDSSGYQPQNGDHASVFATDHNGSIYLALNNGSSVYKLLKRSVTGRAWSEVSTTTLGGAPYVFTATKDGKLIAGGANVTTGYYDGTKWTVIPSPPSMSGSYAFALSVDSTNRLWAEYGMYSYYAPDIFSTTDLGQHWTIESDTSPTFASMVSFGDTTYGLLSGNGLYYFVHGSAGVSVAPTANVEVAIMPNPSTGNVSIEANGARNLTAEIYDMLGNLVAVAKGGSQAIWNGHFGDGTVAAAGVYIVRISGVDSQGKEFLESQKLSIQ